MIYGFSGSLGIGESFFLLHLSHLGVQWQRMECLLLTVDCFSSLVMRLFLRSGSTRVPNYWRRTEISCSFTGSLKISEKVEWWPEKPLLGIRIIFQGGVALDTRIKFLQVDYIIKPEGRVERDGGSIDWLTIYGSWSVYRYVSLKTNTWAAFFMYTANNSMQLYSDTTDRWHSI